VFGEEADTQGVSSEVVVRAISGLQNLAYQLGAIGEQKDLNERLRLPDEIRAKYTVLISGLVKNCLAIPFDLVDTRTQRSLDTDEKHQCILGMISELFGAVSENAVSRLYNIIPDSRWRERVANTMTDMLPRPGDRWKLGIALRGKPEVNVGVKESGSLRAITRQAFIEEEQLTVTGTLIKVDFEGNRLWLKHPVTKKEIECSYLPEIEDELLSARRDLVQVTGSFVMDNDGTPKRLSDIVKIEPVDLSPIIIDAFEYDDYKLVISPALELQPFMDEESKQLMVVEDESINLDVFAYTRDELLDEVRSCIRFLWEAYVIDDATELSKDASELRSKLIARIAQNA